MLLDLRVGFCFSGLLLSLTGQSLDCLRVKSFFRRLTGARALELAIPTGVTNLKYVEVNLLFLNLLPQELLVC